ncbi:MAG: Flp pilus assembly protein TadG [Kiritimatiellia bacterium]|jgi:Flp pilus assembly protein TadG
MNVQRSVRRRRGAAAIEFAMWIPVLAVLFSGIVDVSWMMSRQHNVVRAARDGARVGAVIIEDGAVTPGTDITRVAEEHAVSILNGVGMTCDGGCKVTATYVTSPRAMVTVHVEYDFVPLMGLIPLSTTLTTSFTMMAQQQT